MDQLEFSRWKAVTKTSERRWQMDECFWRNHRVALFYRGGESGTYVRCTPAGTVTIGFYEGAVPHIGEAAFTRLHERDLQMDPVAALHHMADRIDCIPHALALWMKRRLPEGDGR